MQGTQNEKGQGTVEFALAFPLQLIFLLAVLQLAHLSVGAAFTRYAAFCAARAALINPEHRGRVDPQRAARIALLPVTGASLGPAGIGRIPSVPVSIPGTGVRIDPARWPAAQLKTRARVRSAEGVVQAEVEHDFELIVPVANRLFVAFWERWTLWDAPRGPLASLPFPMSRFGAPHIQLTDRCVLPLGRMK